MYRPYKDMTTAAIESRLSALRYELKNIRPHNSGQASNYYAPAIHYHEEELKIRKESE